MRLIGLSASDCIAGKKTESMEYVYPSGRRVPVEVSTERGFAFTLREGELSLHELPLEGGLQVAGLADLKVSERQMRKAEKFRAAHERCELVVFVDGELVDLLVGAKSWEKGLPAGRFPTLDEARAVYQREGVSIIIVPEALEVTRWRREFSRWKARDTRWRFRCDPAFRRVMKRDYPDTHQRLKREDKLFVSLSCRERPRPPLRPPPPPTATP